MTKDELYDLAQELEIEGRSQMDKSELVAALEGVAERDGGSTSEELERSPTSSRTIWRGAINFGLITIPVGLYTAVEDRDVSFHLLAEDDGSRVRYQRINESTGEVIEWEDIVRGYEYEPGRYVTFTDEELDRLQPESGRVIDVSRFAQAEDVDLLYLEKSYYIAPEETAVKPYRLLAEALESSRRVGIAKVAIRQKERLCMIRPRDGLLVLETMHWPDELRIPNFDQLETGVEISPEELEMAQSLIDHLGGEFEPERYQDEFRARVEQAVQDKIEGDEIRLAPPEEPEGPKVTDLLEALRASVDEAREKRSA
ncbi:MAG: Ku protein [Actinobacteria bacterium]|nr:Ku protein [Actinomycetota bacterium]